MSKAKEKKGGKISPFQGCLLSTLLVTCITIWVMVAFIVMEEDEPTSANKDEVASEEGQTNETGNLKDEIRQSIINSAGETANTGEEKIIELNVNDNLGTEEEGDKIVIANLHADENLSSNMTKSGIQLDSIEVFKGLFSIDNVDEVTLKWELPLVDENGNEEVKPVLEISINKDKANEINWEDFDKNNFEAVSTTYWEHSAFN